MLVIIWLLRVNTTIHLVLKSTKSIQADKTAMQKDLEDFLWPDFQKVITFTFRHQSEMTRHPQSA